MKQILIALGVLFASVRLAQSSHPPAVDPAVAAVSGYRHWTQATKHPMQMTPMLWLLCVAPTPAQQKAMDEFNRENPHSNGYLRVYANPPAQRPLMRGGAFPPGSILVKEKMIGPDTGLVARTVMRKHRSGWNPKTGNWEFYVLNKDMQIQNADSAECVSCHREQSRSQWVFRTYLTDSYIATTPSLTRKGGVSRKVRHPSRHQVIGA